MSLTVHQMNPIAASSENCINEFTSDTESIALECLSGEETYVIVTI